VRFGNARGVGAVVGEEGDGNCGGSTSFIGTVISGIAVGVVEEEGTENGTDTEDGIALMSGEKVSVSISPSRLRLESRKVRTGGREAGILNHIDGPKV
jgi:hypothetical protein